MNDYKVKVKGKRFIYRTNIKLTGKGKGIIDSENKSPIELSTRLNLVVNRQPGHPRS